MCAWGSDNSGVTRIVKGVGGGKMVGDEAAKVVGGLMGKKPIVFSC